MNEVQDIKSLRKQTAKYWIAESRRLLAKAEQKMVEQNRVTSPEESSIQDGFARSG